MTSDASDLPPHRAEREALSDLFLERGPDVATLCEGWTAAHLAAHLVVRERDPIAAAGIIVRPLHERHDAAIERRRTRTPWGELVEQVRTGPPVYLRPLDSLINTQEYFVHHEDLRRGQGDTTPRSAASIAGLEDALWTATRRGARFAVRGLRGIGVELVRDGGETIVARKGEDALRILGRPGEITLWLSGRRDAAHVTLEGSDHALAVAHAASLGI